MGSYHEFMSDKERAFLELTDAFIDQRSLPPELWNKTKIILSERDFVDLISLVSQYVFFALNNVCLQVQLEPAVSNLPGIEDMTNFR